MNGLKGRVARLVSAGVLAGALSATISACVESGGQHRSSAPTTDTAIASNVQRALDADPTVGALFIKVESARGIVQLTGFVNSRAEADRAVTVARSVAGAADVQDQLVIKRGSARR